MPYIASVERIGIEKGIQQDMQREQLEQLAENILDAATLEDVFKNN